MAIQEHAYYGSFGYHVTNFFAVSFGFFFFSCALLSLSLSLSVSLLFCSFFPFLFLSFFIMLSRSAFDAWLDHF